MIVDVVSLVFSQKSDGGKSDGGGEESDPSSVKLMNRVVLLKQLIGQRERASVMMM